jgi:hypothetical protein
MRCPGISKSRFSLMDKIIPTYYKEYVQAGEKTIPTCRCNAMKLGVDSTLPPSAATGLRLLVLKHERLCLWGFRLV